MEYLIPLTILFSPLYAWRFSVFSLPTNFLMLWIFFIWVVFIIYLVLTKQMLTFFARTKKVNIFILTFILLFFLSGVLSLFINGVDIKKIGQFLVLFIQPISLFFIGNYFSAQNPKAKTYVLNTIYFLLATMGAYAILQYFTLWGLPPEFWGNNAEPKRAISFFSHPNFYALFSAPLLAFLIPDVFAFLKTINYKLKACSWLLGATGLFLSLSRAGWLGLAGAILVYLIFAANKKIRKLVSIMAIVIVIVLLSIPNFRYRLLLPFYGEKSAVSRLSLWSTGAKAIKESPIFGLGLNGFSSNWQRLNTDPNLDTHNFPHNIFLGLWVETGILGLISFVGLILIFIYKGLRSVPLLAKEGLEPALSNSRMGEVNVIRLSIALFLICLLTQGIIDNPYFKNDLAIVFWITISLSV